MQLIVCEDSYYWSLGIHGLRLFISLCFNGVYILIMQYNWVLLAWLNRIKISLLWAPTPWWGCVRPAPYSHQVFCSHPWAVLHRSIWTARRGFLPSGRCAISKSWRCHAPHSCMRFPCCRSFLSWLRACSTCWCIMKYTINNCMGLTKSFILFTNYLG